MEAGGQGQKIACAACSNPQACCYCAIIKYTPEHVCWHNDNPLVNGNCQ